SGGTAYVYPESPEGKEPAERPEGIDTRCRDPLVEISRLDECDRQALRELLEEHARLTGSVEAVRLLADATAWSRFRKVAPRRVASLDSRFRAMGDCARHVYEQSSSLAAIGSGVACGAGSVVDPRVPEPQPR